MDLRKHFPAMLVEYWAYVLACVISIATLALLYSDIGPIRFPGWWG